jgi:[acyl-carrier-protein] S-malonyltransferase
VVSGDLECLATVTTLANKAGALKTSMLQVSGAFHTDRMASAALALTQALADAKITAPRIPVYSNVTGALIAPTDSIPELLAKQLVSPVRWEDTLRALLADGKDQLYELGPKTQIKSMTKRVSQDAWKKMVNVDVSV